jgi:hypothetical protein
MKTGRDVLGTVENESWRAQQENGIRGPNTAENEFGRAKRENRT